MIGVLPKTLTVDSKEHRIRSDFRDCLKIIEAYGDEELSVQEKQMVMLQILYEDYRSIRDINEALEQGIWFLNCGDNITGAKEEKPVYDWQQDEHMIFAAINRTAGCETRTLKYLHWWSFVSYFYEIGDGMFATVVGIRSKLNKHKKLEKNEQEFYRKNKELVDLKKKYSMEQRAEMDRINKMLE